MVVPKIKESCPLFDIQATVQVKVGSPQTHLETVIILDRNRSYLSKLQLRRNLAYKILCRLSPTKK